MKQFKTFIFVAYLALCSFSIFSLPPREDLESAIETKLNELFPDPENSPGVSLNIYYKGKIYATVNHGVENLKTKKPISNKTVFALASVSKMFTGAAALLLIQDGKVKLSDELKSYLPKFKNAKRFSENSRPYTVGDIVTMTSGFPDYTDIFEEELRKLTNENVYEKIIDVDPVYEVGTKHDYCNTDYNLLATLVEKVSGLSFDEFLKKRFFDPLGMKHTFAVDRPDYKYKFVQGYENDGGDWVEVGEETPGAFGDGNVYTTSKDFEKWENMWYNHKILTKKSIDKAYKKTKLKNGVKIDYNFGWLIENDKKNNRKVSHEGSWKGTSTSYNRWVDRDISYSIFSNIDDVEFEELDDLLEELCEPSD